MWGHFGWPRGPAAHVCHVFGAESLIVQQYNTTQCSPHKSGLQLLIRLSTCIVAVLFWYFPGVTTWRHRIPTFDAHNNTGKYQR